MSQFERVSREYIKGLSSTLNSEGFAEQQTPELSFRPNLDNFFREMSKSISSEIEVIFEPRMQRKAGRPDWRFHHKSHLGIFGYVEAKALDLNRPIDIPEYEQQVRKYISLGHKVILTDGIEFVFFDPERNTIESLSMIEKPIDPENVNLANIDPRLENKFKDFFQEASFRKCSEEELVQAVAKRAKQLSLSVQELVLIPSGAGFTELENKTIEVLKTLYKVVSSHHDSRLTSVKAFGDFVAQVLSFGLLYAHRIIRNSAENPNEKRVALINFWYDAYFSKFSNELGPFKELSKFLREELEYLGYLGTWYQDCLLFLSYVELDKTQIQLPDYHILFERFLEKFDPETKFDFGAFYTPAVLANYAVAFSDYVVKRDLNSELFDYKNKVIDPCCGTGTFIESFITYGKLDKFPQIVGFEILPGPYALAQYRINSLVKSEQARERIKILLTNTVSDELNGERRNGGADLFSDEIVKARDLAQPPITLVIGNPPSSDSSGDGAENEKIINELLEEFRPPETERSGRQNTQKQISNPFVKFLRWSVFKVMESKLGVISLVVPSSFLENASYKWARKYLAEKFSKIYVLDIDSDLRAVDGENIFNVQQGRCLVTAIYDEEKPTSGAKVLFESITSLSRLDKIHRLQNDRINIQLDSFREVNLDSDWSFVYREASDDLNYESRFWKIFDQDNGVFVRNCNGLKLSPTAFFIHSKKELLKRRMIEFSRMTSSAVQDGVNRWFKGQAKPPRINKFTENVLNSIPKNPEEIDSKIKLYSHRPFLNMYAYIDENILKELAGTDGGGARFRPEIVSAYSKNDNFGFAIAPSPKELGEDLHQFVSFCWGIPDNDLCARGNAKIFSLNFPEYKAPRKNWNPTPLPNINSILKQKVSDSGVVCDNLDEAILFYSYAVLCSDFYLSRYSEFLFRTSGSSPRIPFTSNSELFIKISEAGRKLAICEKGTIVDPENLNAQYKLDFQAFKLTSISYDSERKILKLIEDKTVKVEIGDIDPSLMQFSISGYEIIKTWCKFNSYVYTRTDFGRNNLIELGSLVFNLEKYFHEKMNVDALLKTVINSSELI